MTLFIAFKRQNKINAMIRKFTTEDPNADAYPEISSNVYTFPVITNFIIGCDNLMQLEDDLQKIETLRKIDIFDFDSIKNEYLLEDIKKYGKQIY